MDPIRVAIIGGGIKGAATAALLAVHPDIELTVLEADRVASGATSTNHGRLHAGTENWRHENLDLKRRRYLGSVLTRLLAPIGSAPACYCFPQELADDFAASCEAVPIPVRRRVPAAIASPWLADPSCAAFEVPEFPFDPSRLTASLLGTAHHHGAKVQTGRRVDCVTLGRDSVSVLVNDSAELDADIVLNLAARWSASIDVRDRAPLLEIDWFQWRLVCVRADGLPPLDRIVAVSDPAGALLSAIPHRGWITIDAGGVLERVDSPHQDPATNWRPVDLSDPREAALLEQAASRLAPLRLPLDPASVFTFCGIQGRRRAVPPGSASTLFSYPDDERYVVSFGGQASTALLDALELVDHLWMRGLVTSGDGVWSLSRLSAGLDADEAPPERLAARMIWDEVRDEVG